MGVPLNSKARVRSCEITWIESFSLSSRGAASRANGDVEHSWRSSTLFPRRASTGLLRDSSSDTINAATNGVGPILRTFALFCARNPSAAHSAGPGWCRGIFCGGSTSSRKERRNRHSLAFSATRTVTVKPAPVLRRRIDALRVMAADFHALSAGQRVTVAVSSAQGRARTVRELATEESQTYYTSFTRSSDHETSKPGRRCVQTVHVTPRRDFV